VIGALSTFSLHGYAISIIPFECLLSQIPIQNLLLIAYRVYRKIQVLALTVGSIVQAVKIQTTITGEFIW
jgi:hypothetical protein